jgi:hypothetical protein
MFGGLLAAMPSAEQFTVFENSLRQSYGGMKSMSCRKHPSFPASKETVFRKLQQLETLQNDRKALWTFEPIGKRSPHGVVAARPPIGFGSSA